MQNPTHEYYHYHLKKPIMTAQSQLKNLAVIPTEQLDSFSVSGVGATEKEQHSIRSTIKNGYEVFVESVYTVNGRKK
jgi:hypothetical protein